MAITNLGIYTNPVHFCRLLATHYRGTVTVALFKAQPTYTQITSYITILEIPLSKAQFAL